MTRREPCPPLSDHSSRKTNFEQDSPTPSEDRGKRDWARWVVRRPGAGSPFPHQERRQVPSFGREEGGKAGGFALSTTSSLSSEIDLLETGAGDQSVSYGAGSMPPRGDSGESSGPEQEVIFIVRGWMGNQCA